MNKRIVYLIFFAGIPFNLFAQSIVPVKKEKFELRESDTGQFRSPQADLINQKGYNPYSLPLKRMQPGNFVGRLEVKPQAGATEETTAHFVTSAGGGYYFESFEGAYASNLPEGWSNHPSVANAGNIAFYWQAFSPRIQGNPDLQSRTVMSIEGLLSDKLSFDEMFQSPAIEILPRSVLTFNVGFNPAYLCKIDYEKGTFDPQTKNADLEISVVVDGGENSQRVFSLFDASKNDDGFQQTKYRSYSADLSAFAGKKVCLQFRYSGNGVSRIDLDNVGIGCTDKQEITLPALYQVQFTPLCNDADRYEWNFTGTGTSKSPERAPVVCFNAGEATATLKITKGSQVQTYTQKLNIGDPLPAVAKYKHPDGVYLVNTYESKVTPDGYLAPTDVSFRMNNQSLFADEYDWNAGSEPLSVGEVTSDAPELISYLASNSVPCPLLNASNSVSDSTYRHSGNLYLGGNYLVWNMENEIGGQNGKAMQGLGSNSVYQFEAIAEHYSRPLKDQFVGGVLLHFIIAQSTSDYMLTATLRGLESGKELGKSVLHKSKASSDGSYGVFFVFNFPALVKVSEPFAIEISGIPNGENEKLFFVNQYFGINGGKPFTDNTAYFKMKGQWLSAGDLIGYATSLSISPLMISPVKDIYLKDDATGHYKPYNSDKLKLNDAGGTVNMGVISTFPIKKQPETDTDWIRCTSMSIDKGLNYMTFTYDSRSETDRQAVIQLTDSMGITKNFIVYQGSYSGVKSVSSDRTTVLRSGNKIMLSNLLPDDRQLIVYDACGQMIGRMDLLSEGCEYSLPEYNGLYFIRIQGENTRTYKR